MSKCTSLLLFFLDKYGGHAELPGFFRDQIQTWSCTFHISWRNKSLETRQPPSSHRSTCASEWKCVWQLLACRAGSIKSKNEKCKKTIVFNLLNFSCIFRTTHDPAIEDVLKADTRRGEHGSGSLRELITAKEEKYTSAEHIQITCAWLMM